MSEAIYGHGGLRFWSEEEISIREWAITALSTGVRKALTEINSGWRFVRTEGPLLTPRKRISQAYDGSDVWLLKAELGGDEMVMRPETTPASYAVAKNLLTSGYRPPLCVWQAGKSFRRETNDGASASKLRFNEFYQCEFQSIYASTTKADYRAPIMAEMGRVITMLTGQPHRIVDSDRLPAYSEQTQDIEVMFGGRWTEMMSVSTRLDFELEGRGRDDLKVLEIAAGLDRLVSVAVATMRDTKPVGEKGS